MNLPKLNGKNVTGTAVYMAVVITAGCLGVLADGWGRGAHDSDTAGHPGVRQGGCHRGAVPQEVVLAEPVPEPLVEPEPEPAVAPEPIAEPEQVVAFRRPMAGPPHTPAHYALLLMAQESEPETRRPLGKPYMPSDFAAMFWGQAEDPETARGSCRGPRTSRPSGPI